MKRVKVLIPFRYNDELYTPDTKPVELPEDAVERLLAINVNMVLVLGDVEEPVEESVEEQVEEQAEEQVEEPVDKPKRTRKKQ